MIVDKLGSLKPPITVTSKSKIKTSPSTTAEISTEILGWVVARIPVTIKRTVTISESEILTTVPSEMITGKAFPIKYRIAIPNKKFLAFAASTLKICACESLSVVKEVGGFCGGGGGGGGFILLSFEI